MHTYINNNACIIQPLLRLTPPRFQVLFHSFFKVLFIFPSRYLFAIGLLNIFSLWWSLPPTSSCNPKQLDSTKHCYQLWAAIPNNSTPRNIDSMHPKPCKYRVFTFYDLTFQSNYHCSKYKSMLYTPQLSLPTGTLIRIGLFPLHSPLLRESSLFSFPLLS